MNTYISIKKVSFTAYLFCFLLFTAPINGQTLPFDETAYKQTLALKFDYQALTSYTPSTPADAFIYHYRLTLAFLVTENAKITDLLEDSEEAIEDQINKLEGPWQKFFLAEMKIRSAFTNLKLGNELSAAWSIRQAYKLASENAAQYPDFIYNNKITGLLQVLIGSIPEQYQWIVNLMGMSGDIHAGLDQLNLIAADSNVFSIEAALLIRVIEAFLLNNTEHASQNITDISDGSPLLSYIGMAIAMKGSDARKAIDLYKMCNNREQNPLLAYLAGDAYLQLGDYSNAKVALTSFLQSFKGENFIKDAYYKLGLAALLEQNHTKAQELFSTAKNRGQTLTEADKNARKMIENGLPYPTIMKIRLFTDGGQFHKADSITKLVSMGQLIINDQLEFTYRKARLKHKMKEVETAIVLYKNVIALQKSNAYFAPNSCLQLGYIYLKEENHDQAKYFFEKVLTYKNHVYKNSLDNKAKAALKKIKNTSR